MLLGMALDEFLPRECRDHTCHCGFSATLLRSLLRCVLFRGIDSSHAIFFLGPVNDLLL